MKMKHPVRNRKYCIIRSCISPQTFEERLCSDGSVRLRFPAKRSTRVFGEFWSSLCHCRLVAPKANMEECGVVRLPCCSSHFPFVRFHLSSTDLPIRNISQDSPKRASSGLNNFPSSLRSTLSQWDKTCWTSESSQCVFAPEAKR